MFAVRRYSEYLRDYLVEKLKSAAVLQKHNKILYFANEIR